VKAGSFADGRLFGGADDHGNEIFARMQKRFGVGFEAAEHVVAGSRKAAVDIHLADGIDHICLQADCFELKEMLRNCKAALDFPVFSARPLGFQFVFAVVRILELS